MRSFELEQPETLAECLDMLDQYADSALVLAGGTAAVIALRLGTMRPEVVVDLGAIEEMKGIATDAGGDLRLGALVTAAELARSSEVRFGFPVLADTARRLGTVAVRNAVTLGGNICVGLPAADSPVCLCALGAKLTIASARGTRQVELGDFPIGVDRSVLRPTEIVTQIHLPSHPAGVWADATRVTASAADYGALVVVAARARMDRARGHWSDVRIVIGGATPSPTRVGPAEEVLEQGEWDDLRIGEAARLAAAEATVSDFRASAAYRGQLIRVALARILGGASSAWVTSDDGREEPR